MTPPSDWPQWANTVVILLGALGLGVSAMVNNFNSGKKKKGEPKGEASVVTATFMDTQVLQDLRVAVTNVDGTMRVQGEKVDALCDHLSSLTEKLSEVSHQLELDRVTRGRR